METKITFIIPTIGRETLKDTINSLKRQTNPNWNAIIIFDGCKPKYEIKRNDKFLILIIDKLGKENNNAGEVRNKGIELCTTEWVAFIDDDDIISDNYVETFYNEIEEFNNLDVIIFRMSYGIDNNFVLPKLEETNNFYENEVGISFTFKKNIYDLGIKFIASSIEDYELLNNIRESNYKMMISPYVRYFVRNNGHHNYINNTIIGNRVFIN